MKGSCRYTVNCTQVKDRVGIVFQIMDSFSTTFVLEKTKLSFSTFWLH